MYRDINIDDQQLNTALAELSAKLDDLTPLFAGFGEYLTRRHQDSWDAEVEPDGTPWVDLKPATWARKKGTKKLRERGHMLGIRGLTYDAGADQLIFGMTDEKAGWHHFGTQNRAGKTIIPARKLLGINDDDSEEFILQVNDFIKKIEP